MRRVIVVGFAALVMSRAVAALASDAVIVVRDGGADPNWPAPAVVRYDLSVYRGDALRACYAARNSEGEMRVEFNLTATGPTDVHVVRGQDAAFGKCIMAVINSLPTRADGGAQPVSIQFGESP
jgi:hypothetical protein